MSKYFGLVLVVVMIIIVIYSISFLIIKNQLISEIKIKLDRNIDSAVLHIVKLNLIETRQMDLNQFKSFTKKLLNPDNSEYRKRLEVFKIFYPFQSIDNEKTINKEDVIEIKIIKDYFYNFNIFPYKRMKQNIFFSLTYKNGNVIMIYKTNNNSYIIYDDIIQCSTFVTSEVKEIFIN